MFVDVVEVVANPLPEGYTIGRSHIMCNKEMYFVFHFLVQTHIGKHLMFGFSLT